MRAEKVLFRNRWASEAAWHLLSPLATDTAQPLVLSKLIFTWNFLYYFEKHSLSTIHSNKVQDSSFLQAFTNSFCRTPNYRKKLETTQAKQAILHRKLGLLQFRLFDSVSMLSSVWAFLHFIRCSISLIIWVLLVPIFSTSNTDLALRVYLRLLPWNSRPYSSFVTVSHHAVNISASLHWCEYCNNK